MLRTLAVVFALVLPLWFFGRSSPGDEQAIRPVDPSAAYEAFVDTTKGPVPSGAPAGWTCTVRAFDPESGVLRVGYVREDSYLEFSGAQGASFLAEATGRATSVGTVDVDGVPWQDYRDAADHQSLVLRRGAVTVLVGGVRETSSTEELVAFARLVS
jgi:hypothetical protein